jgi:hypothetical protein
VNFFARFLNLVWWKIQFGYEYFYLRLPLGLNYRLKVFQPGVRKKENQKSLQGMITFLIFLLFQFLFLSFKSTLNFLKNTKK